MAGLKIVLPGVFTNNDLPVLRADPILPRAGALILLDPTHTSNPWAPGIPTSTALLPNIAEETAVPLLGDAGPARFTRNASFTGAVGTMERSTKGGLHGIVSQVAGINSVGATLALPDSLKQYLFANQTNDIYVSLWSRVSRASKVATDYATQLANGTSGYLMNLTHAPAAADSYPYKVAETIGRRMTNPRDANGNSIHTAAVTGWLNTPPTSAANINALAANWANGSTQNNPAINKSASWVFYRFYLEDLTVSGRTWAQVDALDYQLYTKEVMTAGGRYYGDTFTSASTIP